MRKPTVDEVLKQGIYGPKEIKPEERRRFLGTLRERIIVVLKKSQVRERKVYPQIQQYMKENKEAHLYLNGTMDYEEISKYIKLAEKNHIEHTIVTNKEHDTDIGLVLAMDYAIDQEEIFIENKAIKTGINKASLFSRLFKTKEK